MNCALAAMVAKGNSLKTHGFAFLWRHAFEVGLAPYVITLVNLSAFQGLPRWLLKYDSGLNDTTKRLLKILRDYAPEGHGHILDSICNAGTRFLEGFCEPRPETYTNWNSLRHKIFEHTDTIAFVGWGIFEELFFETLAIEYQGCEFDYKHNDSILAITMLDQIISENKLEVDWEKLGFNEEDEY